MLYFLTALLYMADFDSKKVKIILMCKNQVTMNLDLIHSLSERCFRFKS